MRRRDEVLVGVFITAALLIGISGSLWLARRGFGSGYPMYGQFPWGAGLKNGQQVLLAGVSVGYVDQVELKPNGYLDVVMEIESEYQVSFTLAPRLRTRSASPSQKTLPPASGTRRRIER